MDTADEIKRLEETKQEILKFKADLAARKDAGEIDGIEYNLLLNEKLEGRSPEELVGHIDSEIAKLQESHKVAESQKKTVLTAGATVAVLLLFAFAMVTFNPDAGPTGFVVTEPSQFETSLDETFSTLTETTLIDMKDVTSLAVSGELQGPGATIKLRTELGELVVATIESTEEFVTYSLSTDKSVYTLGESVSIEVLPEGSDASVYVAKDEENNIVSGPYTPAQEGTYTVYALITTATDILRLETTIEVVNETNVSSQPAMASMEVRGSTSFVDLCDQTCTMDAATNPILVVEPLEGASVTITTVKTTQLRDNLEPVQIAQIEDQVIAAGSSQSIDLSQYFSDPEGTSLVYDPQQVPGLTVSVEASVVTFSSDAPGQYSLSIYVTDGANMVASNEFTVQVLGEGAPEQVVTEQGGQPATPPGQVAIGTCDDPNPNRRPADCILGNEEDYFQEQSISLENLDRLAIGRFTAFGNLVISGTLYENSQAAPGPRDFRVSYEGSDQQEVTTAWIDSSSGDLHLVGMLYEEQFSLIPPSSSFVVQNKKGTNLGYFDRTTGDLFLRGNLVEQKN